MHIKVPPKKTREEFRLIYELNGAQKALNFLAKYYGVRRMKIIVNDRKVGKEYDAIYYDNKAYFKKSGLRKRNVLHEFFHHLACLKDLELPERIEEKEANNYSKKLARAILK